MSYNNREFVNAINDTDLLLSEGKVVVFKKNGSVIRGVADGAVELNNHTLFSDDISYVENGSKKSVDLSDIKSVNGVKHDDFKY